MVFSSYSFLLVFLPIVLILYFGMSRFVSRKVQHVFLIIASLVFYSYADISYVWILLSSIFVNYVSAKFIANRDDGTKRKAVFVFSILFNVGLLGYYKYYMFILENLNFVFDTEFTLRNIILPIGISFFTFQQIAYQISVWKREENVPSFLDYTLFITFFPQLVAGPIVFYQDVIRQYQNEENRFFNIENFSQGLFIFCIGLFKKAVLANNISLIAENGYSSVSELSFGGAWATSLAYTLQIFLDFSGYSDMAIGLGKMMNINIPVNFYSPYKSKSITEFWQRWHITLGRSLAVLIYYPLGGNRKGKVRTCFNLFIVFLVSGIWHGAAWKFIIWGVMHGVVRIIEKVFDKQILKVPIFLRWFFTFIFVNVAWVLFAAPSLADALLVLEKMFIPNTLSLHGLGALATDGVLNYPDQLQIAYVVLSIIVLLFVSMGLKKNSIDWYNSFRPTPKYAVSIAILFCLSITFMSKSVAFIYFNF